MLCFVCSVYIVQIGTAIVPNCELIGWLSKKSGCCCPFGLDGAKAMPMICELSGEPLLGKDDVVVTPSGHVCFKKLLLSKLADNGGTDPFVSDQKVPLNEDDLITLQPKNNKDAIVMPPRPTATTSIKSVLELLGEEYQNLVLELFDTRKALESTRQELSQALYQNDAAVRVVARLATERDAARQEWQQWQAQTPPAPVAAVAGEKRSSSSSQAATTTTKSDEPPSKRVKKDDDGTIQEATIPVDDSRVLLETWQALSQRRKQEKKQTAAAAPTPDALAKYQQTTTKSYHSTKSPGVLAVAYSEPDGLLATAGKDKQLCVYNMTSSQVQQKWTGIGVLGHSLLDIRGQHIVVSSRQGAVKLFELNQDEAVATWQVQQGEGDGEVVAVQIHPSSKHVVVTTTKRIGLYSMTTGEELTYFTNASDVTTGALHPDGLIYAVGTVDGKLLLWDFKSQKLASTLAVPETTGTQLTSIVFSNNGYHVATLGNNGKLYFWDLKKQAVLKTMEVAEGGGKIESMAFDVSGKFLAYGTSQAEIVVTTVKEWGSTAVWKTTKKGQKLLVWTGPSQNNTLVGCNTTERAVRFFSLAES